MDQIPQYNSWRDQANNIGIQCAVCFRTHWNDEFPVIDPTTQQPCENCQLIKDLKIRANAQKTHNEERNGCVHKSSQPQQDIPPSVTPEV